jgi:hypothetical protein
MAEFGGGAKRTQAQPSIDDQPSANARSQHEQRHGLNLTATPVA